MDQETISRIIDSALEAIEPSLDKLSKCQSSLESVRFQLNILKHLRIAERRVAKPSNH